MPDPVDPISASAPLAAIWSNKTTAGAAKRLRGDVAYRREVSDRLREVADALAEWSAPPSAPASPPVDPASEDIPSDPGPA